MQNFALLPRFESLALYLCGPNGRKAMKEAANSGNTGYEAYDSLRQDRDRWVQMAMEQQQYIRQLEEKVYSLEKQLGEKVSQVVLFCRITHEAYDRNKAQAVESELRSACGSAPKLIRVIRTNEALGYLDTQNLSSKELYELLDEHFGLSFGLRAFQIARSQN